MKRSLSIIVLVLMSGTVSLAFQVDSTLYKQAVATADKAKEAHKAKMYQDAIRLYGEAFERFGQAKAVRQQAQVRYRQGESYYLNYQDSIALITLDEAAALAEQVRDSSLYGDIMLQKGQYLYKLGHNEESIALNRKLIDYAKSSNNITVENYAQNTIGLILKDMGKYDESLTTLYAVLKTRETNSIFSLKDISRSLLNIGLVLDVLKRSDEAIAYYNRALKLKLQDGDSIGVSRVYSNIAVILKNNKEYEKALVYIDSSNVIISKVGDENDFFVNYTNMGTIYKRMGDVKRAEEYYNKALAIAIRTQQVQLEGNTYLNLATMMFEGKQYQKSIDYLQRALKLAEYTKSPLSKYEIHGSLSEAYAAAGMMADAYKHIVLSNEYRDTLNHQEQLRVIEETKAAYETEKKEQRIALQQSQLAEQKATIQRTNSIVVALIVIVILVVIIFLLARSRFKKRQELAKMEHDIRVREAYIDASLQSQENERKRFAQDLHDGMGQLISALRLTLENVDTKTALEDRVSAVNKSEKILTEMHQEIRSIAFNLMPHTLIQYGLIPALREMASRITETGKVKIIIADHDLPERLSEIQEISLYRIIQEWINNVLKYADATTIDVQIVRNEGEITTTIEDNGKGFNATVLSNSKGNGWKNIQSRLSIIKGDLELDTTPGHAGTTLILYTPATLPEVAMVSQNTL